MDRRAAEAREHHKRADTASEEAARHRSARNALLRELHADGYGYGAIARMVGISKSLVAQAVGEGAAPH